MPVIFYRSNFCPECGNETEQRQWWQHRYFCAHCAKKLGRKWDWLPIAFAIGGLTLGLLVNFGRRPTVINQAMPLPTSATSLSIPLVSAQDATAQLKPAPVTQPTTTYLCGARTKKGTACKHRVAAAGLRCFQHQGMRALKS
jgi:hypothetical protein